MNGGSNGGSKKVEPPETLIFQGVPLVEVAGFIRKLNLRGRHCRAFRSFRLTRRKRIIYTR